MRHDVAQPDGVEAAHEYDGAGFEADAAAHRPDAVSGGLRSAGADDQE
jgi:hypothetical protein